MQVKQSLRLNDGGLWARFELNGKHFSVNLDNMQPARWFAAEYRAQVAAEKAFEATSGPTIADLIEQGHLPPLAGDKAWQRIMNSAELSPAAVWSGDGLPPIGCECEALAHDASGIWLPVKILAHDVGHAVYRLPNGAYRGDSEFFRGDPTRPLFRPLRTAEQLAAEAREKAIDEMAEATEVGFPSRILLGDLYDAGYRKSDA